MAGTKRAFGDTLDNGHVLAPEDIDFNLTKEEEKNLE